MCPKCGHKIEAKSASLDKCSNRRCDYTFFYPSAYPDDIEGNRERHIPFDKKKPKN